MVYVQTLDLEAGSKRLPHQDCSLFGSGSQAIVTSRYSTGFVLVVGESMAAARWMLFFKGEDVRCGGRCGRGRLGIQMYTAHFSLGDLELRWQS